MKAAVLREFGAPLVIEERSVPIPAYGEALVRVMASGLCLTDCHIQDGLIGSVRLPYIPGHEMAGVVESLGPGAQQSGLRVGQHVVCGIDITCGQCRLCRTGRENLCRERVRIGFERNGSYAQYAAVPARNLYPIAEHVPFEQAAVIPDAVACMYHAIRDVSGLQPGDRALVFGAGGLGLQGVQMLVREGIEACAAARTDKKLERALELGAGAVINTARTPLVREALRLTGGEGFDAVFDLVGNEQLDALLECIRPGGRLVALGYAANRFSGVFQEMVIKEKEIRGVRGSTARNMRECIAMVENGSLVPEVTRVFRLEEVNEALSFLRAGKGIGRSVLMLHRTETGELK